MFGGIELDHGEEKDLACEGKTVARAYACLDENGYPHAIVRFTDGTQLDVYEVGQVGWIAVERSDAGKAAVRDVTSLGRTLMGWGIFLWFLVVMGRLTGAW
jgi:hypothetical protein